MNYTEIFRLSEEVYLILLILKEKFSIPPVYEFAREVDFKKVVLFSDQTQQKLHATILEHASKLDEGHA